MTTSHSFISKHPMTVNQREEIADLLREITSYPLLTPQQERELAIRSLSGDKSARDRLVNCNLRLVVAIAKSVKTSGILSFSDLVQEGSIGLVQAAKRFDPVAHPGVRFASFAGILIRNSISDALGENTDSFSLPGNVYAARKALWKVQDTFLSETGREPTDTELARLTGLSSTQVKAAQLGMASVSSLDFDEEDARAVDVADPDADVEEEATGAATWSEIAELLPLVLSYRERLVLLLHYGLGDTNAKPRTLKMVGRAMGLSREAARLLEMDALEKVRHAYETGRFPAFRQLVLLDEAA